MSHQSNAYTLYGIAELPAINDASGLQTMLMRDVQLHTGAEQLNTPVRKDAVVELTATGLFVVDQRIGHDERCNNY